MYDVIKEKFNICQPQSSYQRINSTHPFDIYLGFSETNKKSLIIIAKGNIEEVESSRMISVNIYQRNDNNITISFELLEDEMSDLFYRFCADIIESSNSNLSKDIIHFAIQRWKDWISLFKNPLTSLLSELEVKGLLGELIFLNNFMFKKYGYEKSLNAWMGPTLAHKDFEINNTWYEIKTINQNGISVKISSIEQLDASVDGNLVVLFLERSNAATSTGITLNSYIEKVRNILPQNLHSLFDMKITQARYKYEKDYDQYYYSLKNEKHYIVNNDFPRLKKDILPKGIVKTSYELLLESIETFKIGGD